MFGDNTVDDVSERKRHKPSERKQDPIVPFEVQKAAHGGRGTHVWLTVANKVHSVCLLHLFGESCNDGLTFFALDCDKFHAARFSQTGMEKHR